MQKLDVTDCDGQSKGWFGNDRNGQIVFVRMRL